MGTGMTVWGIDEDRKESENRNERESGRCSGRGRIERGKRNGSRNRHEKWEEAVGRGRGSEKK